MDKNKKIRVLQAIGSLRLGGAENVSVNIYKNIDKDKYEFHYLVYGNEIGELEEEVLKLKGKIIRISPPRKNLLRFMKDLHDVIRKNGPYDVIHAHPLFNSGLIMKVAHKEGIKIRISHAHSSRYNQKISIIKKIYIEVMRKSINKFSTHYFACSKDAGNYLFGEKVFEKKGTVIKNGINLENYIFNKNKRTKIRHELGIDDELIIGNVGRLESVKNQEFILDIFKEIKHKKSSKLIIVGDGSLKRKLSEKAKLLGIEKDIILLGARKDVNDILQAMDIFIFPSKYEGLGISLIEAQASGLKCIISDCIPKEVEITNLITRISLREDKKTWAYEILRNSNKYERVNNKKSIVANGYDIKNSNLEIEKVYNEIQR